ncbi:MAG: efflux RND transporter permease subunit [Bacteroidales bacterium]|jgi:HAE1 family hydrophobic/amphiphilic exporter-1|nr:efflux RND transporter permease subunit [Bacteroidales bacterium]MCI2122325.1 efflux RND transporter permease subunit [Bacteroidales bacterium]MCI2145349.1 efflux RND transporter permease subunit [Bacteroidales bacterium]
MSIYKTAVNRPVFTALLYVAIAVFGIFSLSKLSISNFPDVDSSSVMVMTTYSGASAEDIEANISKVLENSLNSVPNLKHITSRSSENTSLITMEFVQGINMDEAMNNIRDKLDMVADYLPDGASTPMLFKFGSEEMPILILSVTAKESMNGLYKILDDRVVTELERIDGVGTVGISGIPEREVHVNCDPYKLEAYGLTIEGISKVIAAENQNTPAGSIDIGSDTYSLRVQKEFTDASQLRDLVVGTSNGAAVYLKDIAVVKDTVEERSQESYTNNLKGGQIVIQKQAGANSVNIAKAVKAKLPEIIKTLPSDVKIGVIVDSSDSIINTIGSLGNTIIIILLIVMLVVYLFLGRWRATFVIVLTIPISLLAALIYLFATKNTLNIISMSALSIAIGMVVDNAIVVLENITTHIERGSKPKQAAIYATNEVGIAVMASTLTTIAVFLPLTMIKGMTGVLFKQLGWMVTIILSVSTLAAMTLTPMLCSKLLVANPKSSRFHDIVFKPITTFLQWLGDAYAKLLAWALHHKALVLCCAAAIFLVVIIPWARNMKTEFFPTEDNGRISATVELPMGTRQEITRNVAMRITDEWLSKYPEVERCNFTEGVSEKSTVFAAMSTRGTNIISFNVRLCSASKRKRTLGEICDCMRNDLKQYPEIRIAQVTEGGFMGGMGGQSSVDVEIYGYDFAATDKIAAELMEKMKKEPSVSQVTVSRDQYTPEYRVDFDREKLALHGLNSATAASYLRNRINGSVDSYYREDGDEYDIRVRSAREFRTSLEDIENIMLYNSAGQGVRIGDVARIRESYSPPTIERKDRQRVITVYCVVAHGAATSDVIKTATKHMGEIEMPIGITYKFGGSYEDQKEMFSDIITLMMLIIILVYIIMAAQFESLKYPFAIMFSIPFALVGVVIGLWLNGQAMGVMTLLGVLMLVGIVVNNGIVLIDYTRLCRERGDSIFDAVVKAGRSRLRPILMTTLTTVFGMIPMAVGHGEGSEMWRPLGVSVAWGLSFSTVVTLVLIPVIYSLFAKSDKNTKMIAAEEVKRIEEKAAETEETIKQ